MTNAQSRVGRPGLTPRQRTGALLAGGIGFSLICAGLDTLVAAVVVVALFVFILLLWGGISDAFAPGSDQATGFAAEIIRAFGEALWPVAIIGLIAVSAAIVGGFLLSGLILRRTGNARSRAISWSGLGIGLVAHAIIASVLTAVSSALGDRAQLPGDSLWWLTVAVLILMNAAIGALSWWWMAWAFRRRPSSAEEPAPVGPTPYESEPIVRI